MPRGTPTASASAAASAASFFRPPVRGACSRHPTFSGTFHNPRGRGALARRPARFTLTACGKGCNRTLARPSRLSSHGKEPRARRTPAGQQTTAAGRSPGLRVIVCCAPPSRGSQWRSGARTRRSQLRGQPRISRLQEPARHRVPFSPHGWGTCRNDWGTPGAKNRQATDLPIKTERRHEKGRKRAASTAATARLCRCRWARPLRAPLLALVLRAARLR